MINVSLKSDPKLLAALDRIANAIEAVAESLKPDAIDPAAVEEQTLKLKTSSDALKQAVDENQVPNS